MMHKKVTFCPLKWKGICSFYKIAKNFVIIRNFKLGYFSFWSGNWRSRSSAEQGQLFETSPPSCASLPWRSWSCFTGRLWFFVPTRVALHHSCLPGVPWIQTLTHELAPWPSRGPSSFPGRCPMPWAGAALGYPTAALIMTVGSETASLVGICLACLWFLAHNFSQKAFCPPCLLINFYFFSQVKYVGAKAFWKERKDDSCTLAANFHLCQVGWDAVLMVK